MPLPPALAAKLVKRGLTIPTKVSDKGNRFEAKSILCCPNKYNIYHECNSWCQFHWKPHITPEPRYLKNLRKLLDKYPITNNCTELFDAGVGRYYYWDVEKNMVSWLPPSHPKASQTEPASKLRLKSNRMEVDTVDQHLHKDLDKRKDRHSDRRDNDDDRKYKDKYDDRDRNRRRGRKEELALDPMDPAAYSDIPRGGWGDGLENNKNKADTTASGTLFQQRPYPSPGDVLEANKKKDIKKK